MIASPIFTATVAFVSSHVATITLTAPAHHHFNIQAPMSAEVVTKKTHQTLSFQVKEKKKNLILFQLQNPEVGADDAATVSAFLCDDAKTYCVKKKLVLALNQTATKIVENTNENESKTEVKNKNQTLQKNNTKDNHGFWDNAPEEAIAEANTLHKPLMIEFYAIWCPPCNLLNELVFSKKAFKKAAEQFVLLKMDADRDSSWELKSKLKVGGYPTIIFANSKLVEINRLVGFVNMNELIDQMSDAYVHQDKGLVDRVAELKGKLSYLTALKTLINWYLDQNEMTLAKEKIEEGLKVDSADTSLKVLLEIVQNKNTQFTGLIPELNNKIETATLVRAEEALMKAVELKENKTNEKVVNDIKSKILLIFDELYSRVDPKTMFAGELSQCDIDELKIDFADAMHDEVMLKKAYEAGLKSRQTLITLVNGQDSRGLNLELAYLFRKTGRIKEAKAVYQKFIKKYPTEFTFYFAATKFYFEQHDLKMARETSENAVKYGYGDNQIRAMQMLAKVMAEQGETKLAIEKIDEFLKKLKLPSGELKVRTLDYVNQLKEVKETITRKANKI